MKRSRITELDCIRVSVVYKNKPGEPIDFQAWIKKELKTSKNIEREHIPKALRKSEYYEPLPTDKANKPPKYQLKADFYSELSRRFPKPRAILAYNQNELEEIVIEASFAKSEVKIKNQESPLKLFSDF